MYLFFDENGTLKEQITVSPPRYGDENVNAIYVYWDNEVTETITKDNVYCRYKKPNGEYTINNLTADDVVNATIPYDQNRDLKFFHYNQTYRFYVFNIPTDIFVELEDVDVYSVLFSCWFIYDGEQKTMGLSAFAVEPSTQSVAVDKNINIAQWNELIKMLTGTADFKSIDVQNITFKESSEPSENGLSMVDNIIYWYGAKLLTPSDLNSYVTLGTSQTISNLKTFTGGLRISGNPLNIQNRDDIPLIEADYHDDVYNYSATFKIIADNSNDDWSDNEYTIQLPNDDGTLALDKNTVNLTGNQNVAGNKNFTGNVTKNNKNLLDTDALKPTILTPATSGETAVTLQGGTATLTEQPAGAGTYTVTVRTGYNIVATINGGVSGDITNIDQETGIISYIAPAGTVLIQWQYEGTPVAFKFNIGSDYNGIYVFTHSYLTMLIPIYALSENFVYKFTGPGLQNNEGSVINMIHNMQRVGTNLIIWSGNSDYPMIAGRVGTLAKVKLY